jgi:hypothetical protein
MMVQRSIEPDRTLAQRSPVEPQFRGFAKRFQTLRSDAAVHVANRRPLGLALGVSLALAIDTLLTYRADVCAREAGWNVRVEAG